MPRISRGFVVLHSRKAHSSKSILTVSSSVPKNRTAAAFLPAPRTCVASQRCRMCGSSSARICAVPLYQRPRNPSRAFIRTRGFASMLRTYPDCLPCSATIQNCVPTRPSPTGVRRGFPVLRPTVSSSAYPGRTIPAANNSLIGGFKRYFCRKWTTRCFKKAYSLKVGSTRKPHSRRSHSGM